MDQPASEHLNPNGHDLRDRLQAAQRRRAGDGDLPRINVAGVGGVVSAAYEQLRNAAEYTQEHLLRQRAIRRFYARNLSMHTQKDVGTSIADELIIELTQAGYIENRSQTVDVGDKLMKVIRRHYGNLWRMREANIRHDFAHGLTLDLLSVESEALIGHNPRQEAFTMFAYYHYLTTLPREQFVPEDVGQAYENGLYVAVHKALRKSDLATIRYDMQRLQNLSDHDIHEYVRFFVTVDNIYYSDSNDKLTRHINKYGAPLRVLRGMIESKEDTAELLTHKEQFLKAYEKQVRRAYEDANHRLNKGVIKSIIFLLITKSLVGLAVEIPYDLLLTGSVIILPLIINLLTPIVYMALLRSGLRLPGDGNTAAIRQYADTMLYRSGGRELYAAPRKKRYGPGFTAVFGFSFFLVFGLVVWGLIRLHFNIVQGIIFFIFMGTASFLGFRLSRIVRELELVAVRPGLIASARDFLYLPFILLGQWLSDKYARVNIIALILDTVIELPLKTILRLIRQWADFISDKQDQI